MKSILKFSIEKGDRQYVAQGIDIPVVTQGKTLDELAANLQEAVELYLEGGVDDEEEIAGDPAILLQYEISAHA